MATALSDVSGRKFKCIGSKSGKVVELTLSQVIDNYKLV